MFITKQKAAIIHVQVSFLQDEDTFNTARLTFSYRCLDFLPQDQYFAILFLDNAGTDLESYRFDKACGWRQAVDVLWQIADALSAAEEQAEFEVCCPAEILTSGIELSCPILCVASRSSRRPSSSIRSERG